MICFAKSAYDHIKNTIVVMTFMKNVIVVVRTKIIMMMVFVLMNMLSCVF